MAGQIEGMLEETTRTGLNNFSLIDTLYIYIYICEIIQSPKEIILYRRTSYKRYRFVYVFCSLKNITWSTPNRIVIENLIKTKVRVMAERELKLSKRRRTALRKVITKSLFDKTKYLVEIPNDLLTEENKDETFAMSKHLKKKKAS